MATSQNGFRANDRGVIKTYTIPGTTRKIALREGVTGELLVHFAAWFDKNIESVDGGILDDWGYAERPIRGSRTTLSNHASGTAIDLNAPRHPLGRRGTFSDAQEKKIRAKLREYEGAIRWGGDYKNRADEMHFEINADEATCRRVLAKVTAPKEKPMNHVQSGRYYLAELKKNGAKALAEFDEAPEDREAVKSFATTLREVLRVLREAENRLPEK